MKLAAIVCILAPLSVSFSLLPRCLPAQGSSNQGSETSYKPLVLNNSSLKTVKARISSIGEHRNILYLEVEGGEELKCRMDENHTLIFRGNRPLRIVELKPDTQAEIDYLVEPRRELPIATWIEIEMN